jgi:hypothetical protein
MDYMPVVEKVRVPFLDRKHEQWQGAKQCAFLRRRAGKRRRKKCGERNGANAKCRNASDVQPSKREVRNMQGKKKKTKKGVKVDDLKPAKNPKGGMLHSPPHDVKWILKHLQLGQNPGSGGKTGPNSPL